MLYTVATCNRNYILHVSDSENQSTENYSDHMHHMWNMLEKEI